MTAPNEHRQRLYRAYSAAYAHESSHRQTVFAIDAALAAVGIVCALTGWGGDALALAGLGWLLIREFPVFLNPDEYRRKAVTIQEQFDVAHGGLDWNEPLCGRHLQQHEINQLAASSDAVLEDDYWINTGGLPPPIGALLRQKQSAAWGQEGHRRYSLLNSRLVAATIGLLVAFAIWPLDLDLTDALLSVFAPAAPLLVGRIQSARRHLNQSNERKSIDQAIEDALSAAPPTPTPTFVRSMQDRLYRLRLDDDRIPQWLYKRYRDLDQRTIDVALQDDVDRLRQRLP